MVKNCEECGEYAWATRYKDSYLMFCRACGYWKELDDAEGFYDDEKLEEMRERWPLRGGAPDGVNEDWWSS